MNLGANKRVLDEGKPTLHGIPPLEISQNHTTFPDNARFRLFLLLPNDNVEAFERRQPSKHEIFVPIGCSNAFLDSCPTAEDIADVNLTRHIEVTTIGLIGGRLGDTIRPILQLANTEVSPLHHRQLDLPPHSIGTAFD